MAASCHQSRRDRSHAGLAFVLPAFVLLALGPLATGLTSAPLSAQSLPAADHGSEASDNDPFEGLNRLTHGFNNFLRKALIDPLVDVYQALTPDPIEEALSNAAANLSEAVTAGASLLQGDFENAGTAVERFLVNTTVGIGGLGDPASAMGLEARREDLGQAAAVGGVEAGPHIVLPILGPSNFRDATGRILTSLVNPLPLVGEVAAGTVEYSRHQDAVNAIGENALDPYIAERTAYEQNRAYEIRNGLSPMLEFEDTPAK